MENRKDTEQLAQRFLEGLANDHCSLTMFAGGFCFDERFRIPHHFKSETIALIGGPAMRIGFGGNRHDCGSVSTIEIEDAPLPADSQTVEKPMAPMDFTGLEDLECHSSPNLGQKIDVLDFEPVMENGDDQAAWHNLGRFAILSNGGFSRLASKGSLKEALDWIEALEKNIREKATIDQAIWNQLDLEETSFGQFIDDLRKTALFWACVYLRKSSPLDDPTFSKCAQEVLAELSHSGAIDLMADYFTLAELQRWSNELTPMRIYLTIRNLGTEIGTRNFSRELRTALSAAVICHCLSENMAPIITERQFARWSRVVSTVFIAELEQEFKLAIKADELGRQRLILETM